MDSKNARSWVIVIAVCLICTGALILSILPSLLYGSEILKSSLCVNNISIEKAAGLTGYTGCIDSAYQISHIVCIIDGNTTHCVSVDNKKRRSKGGGTYHGVAIPDSQPRVRVKDTVGLLTMVGPNVFERVMTECENPDSNESTRCEARMFSDSGYSTKALMHLSYLASPTKDDINFAQELIDNLEAIYNDTELVSPQSFFLDIKKRYLIK